MLGIGELIGGAANLIGGLIQAPIAAHQATVQYNRNVGAMESAYNQNLNLQNNAAQIQAQQFKATRALIQQYSPYLIGIGIVLAGSALFLKTRSKDNKNGK
ncbi:MAG: hypothetical protein ACKVOU_03645 [Cytophagales bacterium]